MSTIDHFFVNSRLLENCVSAAPIKLGDNPSNHSPIMLQIEIPEIIGRTQIKPIYELRPNWKQAEKEDTNDFSQTLHEQLLKILLTQSIQCTNILCKDPNHAHERDNHAVEVLINMIETSYDCIPLTKVVINSDEFSLSRSVLADIEEAESFGTETPTVFFNINKNNRPAANSNKENESDSDSSVTVPYYDNSGSDMSLSELIEKEREMIEGNESSEET